MADTYEKDLGQKSSLTTSDFIRVVGSDNVSYKQPIPSILAAMGLSLYYTDTNSTDDGSNDDARFKASVQRVLTTFSNSKPTVNRAYPIMLVASGSSAGTFCGVVNVTSTAMRFFLSYSNINFSGQFLRSSNTISVFQRLPSRTEVDALNSKSLIYQRALTQNDDCDTLTQGIYTFNTSTPQNAPSGAVYGTLIVIEGTYGASVFNFQLLSTAGRGLYYRRKQGNSSSDGFAAWTKVTGTQV